MLNNLIHSKVGKYHLVYRKDNGRIYSYRISVPIDTNEENDTFTSYAYGHGVRTFKGDRIVRIHKIHAN